MNHEEDADLVYEDAKAAHHPKHKNGKIEFLRFLFAVSILLFHVQKRFVGVNGTSDDFELVFFGHGCIGVEFFFLVSGYLLAASWYRRRNDPTELLGSETAGVMKRKILAVFPYHLFAIAITIAVNMIFIEDTASDRFAYLLHSWPSIFMVQVFGFETNWANRLTWYLDVWLMVTFILYPLGRKYYDVICKIVCPLAALFILGYLDYETGALSDADAHIGFFYKVFLRGLGEMCLGCSAYSLTRRMNRVVFTKAGRWLMALSEIAGYAGIFLYANFEYQGRYEFLVLFIMYLLVILTFSAASPYPAVFDRPIFLKMGKFSLLIYLNQFYVIRLVQHLAGDVSYPVQVLACVAGTFAGAWLCRWTVQTLAKTHPVAKIIRQM